MTTHYIPRESNNVRDLIRASAAGDGYVEFAHQGGGFVHRAPEAEFHSRFREVPETEFAAMAQRHVPIRVGGDWVEREEDALPAWSNGLVWNGWEMPVFSKETVLSPQGRAVFNTDTCWTLYDETADAFLLLSSLGEPLFSGQSDFSQVASRVAATGQDYIDSFLFHGHEIEVSVHRAETIQLADGTTAKGYALGDGWCWEALTEEDNVPSAPSL